MWGLFIRQGELAAKAWTEKEATSVASLLRTLKETSRYHASSFNADEIRVLRKMLQWPAQHRFPGIVLCTVCDLQQLKFSLYSSTGLGQQYGASSRWCGPLGQIGSVEGT